MWRCILFPFFLWQIMLSMISIVIFVIFESTPYPRCSIVQKKCRSTCEHNDPCADSKCITCDQVNERGITYYIHCKCNQSKDCPETYRCPYISRCMKGLNMKSLNLT